MTKQQKSMPAGAAPTALKRAFTTIALLKAGNALQKKRMSNGDKRRGSVENRAIYTEKAMT